MKITAEQIRALAPRAKAAIVDAIVSDWDYAVAAGIDSRLETVHFLATITHESTGLTKCEENMNYTTPQRLRAVFPTRFKTAAAAKPYVRQPRKLANKVYGGRYGNTGPDDGWLYRGGGLIQTTFKANYEAVGFADNPEALREPGPAFRSAVDYWKRKKCGVPALRDDARGVRKLVQGADGGLADVQDLVERAKGIWTDEPEAAEPERAFTKEEIENVQKLLREAGYYEVGEPDGKFGKRTRNALNAFKADNGLPTVDTLIVNDNITEDVLVMLAEGRKREESPERSDARTKDIAKKSVSTAEAIKNKVWSGFAAIGSFVVTVFWGIVSTFQEAWEYTETWRNTLYKVSPVWWFALATGIALFIFLRARKVERRMVDDYRKGKKL